MQILKYYINHKGGINSRLVCRVVNSRFQTLQTFYGNAAEDKAEKYIKNNKKALYEAYNTNGLNINPYACDAKKMPVRKFTSVHIKLSLFGFPSFSASGSVEGMRNQYYGKGALLVCYGDYIYNVTSAPDIYYNHSTPLK